MLRYIYLLCFIYFELVYCYQSIHGKEHRRLRRKQEYVAHRDHKTTRSASYDNLDMINFMKPEAEVFDSYNSYNYEKPQRLSIDELPLPRLRRSRHEPSPAREQAARAHNRLHNRQLAHHPKRKCSFALFPFFSHKNKTKPKVKHGKRKSHSFKFSKPKVHGYNPPLAPDKREQKKSQITDNIEVTTMKDIAQHCKLKNSAKIIHNSRLYFANPYRINDEDPYGT